MLTYISLVSAVIGIIQTTRNDLDSAILCLIISGICDGFDGTIARTKKDRNEDEKMFGIQIDSLCDVISFGIFPAILSFYLGLNDIFGIIIVISYCLCAVIRLAFFNVVETKRQKVESGCNKFYHGLPVTSISIILPFFYIFKSLTRANVFSIIMHCVIGLTSFLFVLDFKVKKFHISLSQKYKGL